LPCSCSAARRAVRRARAPTSTSASCSQRLSTADALAASRKRLDYLATSNLDVRVFQEVPLYIRHRILKEGQLLFVREEGADSLYGLALRTAREFERFKPIYREYLEQVARAGS